MNDVIIEEADGIRTVRMNRPAKRNALTSAMYDAMAEALETANGSVRCLLIAGARDAFCAGNDLQDFLRATSGGGGLSASVLRFLHALARCEHPLVAAVSGVAVGVGTTMLLHCDHVVAGDNARFSTPFVQLGLVPEAASSLLAPRLMGQRRAFSLLVMGEILNAQEAKEAGLVNTVVPAGEVDAAALRAARTIAALPPGAVAEARRLMRGSPDEIIAHIDAEAQVFRERLRSPEARAAFEAFLTRKT